MSVLEDGIFLVAAANSTIAKFRSKYHQEPTDTKSGKPVGQKLKKNKNQAEQQCKQAYDAVSISQKIQEKKSNRQQ